MTTIEQIRQIEEIMKLVSKVMENCDEGLKDSLWDAIHNLEKAKSKLVNKDAWPKIVEYPKTHIYKPEDVI